MMTSILDQHKDPAQALSALEATAAKRSVSALDGNVMWRCWGDGPSLVLLHGGYGSWAHWSRVIEPLSVTHRVMVPDMPGFGESDDAPKPDAPETMADRLRLNVLELLQDQGDSSGKPIICGFSFGGVIAGHMAALLGDQCDRLVLVAPGGLGAPRGPMEDLIPRSRSMSEDEKAAAHCRNLEILMFADPAKIDALAVYIQTRNTDHYRVKSRPISSTDTLARALKRVAAPTRLIWGDRDVTIGPYGPERIDILNEVCLDVRVIIEPGAGHWIMYEDPDRFVDLFNDAVQA